MEREDFLTIAALCFGGVALLSTGFVWSRRACEGPLAAEALAWRRLWVPLAPALFVVSLLVGWWLQADDMTSDDLESGVFVLAVPGLLITARAVLRAVLSAVRARSAQAAAVTIGLIKPKIIVAASFVAELSPGALAAVTAHEEAHRRHHDPLRLWLGQLASDLQFPWPQARGRFQAWRGALELARDFEACDHGADPLDRADAIVIAARRDAASMAVVAGVASADVEARVKFLLDPPTHDERHVTSVWPALVMLSLAIGTAAFIWGDDLLGLLPGVARH